MADFYKDTDTGSDANDGTTWALAKLTQEGVFSVMSAGDNGWVQGAAADTASIDRTFASPGTIINPCKVIGVVDGTTAEPPTLSDLAVTLPVISTTGAGADNNHSGSTVYCNLDISTGDRTSTQLDTNVSFINCKIAQFDRWTMGTQAILEFINCVYEPTGTSGVVGVSPNSKLSHRGGSWVFTAAANLTRILHSGDAEFIGVDLSGLTAPIMAGISAGRTFIKNCKMPASFTMRDDTSIVAVSSITVISSDDSSSVPVTDSIQDYRYEDIYGTIDLETTAVRTGGADDGASGAFSYAMIPSANSTLESSQATLKSPWMSVWVEGGSNTLTVYIANDSASTDYNEDEVWVEFYTADSGDTAQYDLNFDPDQERLFDSTTAITDDTGSTWGTGANNHQKFSVTVTTGYEGEVRARLHLAKRQATPDTLFLDPVIEVT